MPTPPPPIEHRYVPGQSGNPGGRPKISITAEMARYIEFEYLALVAESKRDELTVKEKIAINKLLQACKDEDYTGFNQVAERLEGKVTQRIELVGTEQLEENKRLLKELAGIPDVINPPSTETG